MNRFKFAAFLTEFPPLRELLVDRLGRPREARYCDGISIKRLDSGVLNYIPTYNSWDGSLVMISKKETVSFVMDDGTLMQDAVLQEGEHGSNYAHHQKSHESGEKVIEAIWRNKCAKSLRLVVVVRTGFTVREHYSEPNFTVAIYKAAKGESLTQMIEEAAFAALTEVRAEANF